MKTRRIILIILGLLIIGTIVFFIINKNNRTFDIVIENDTESYYLWDFEIKDKSIVEFVKTKEEVIDESTIKKHYEFKVLKNGTTKIVFKNNKDESVVDIKTYEVKIDKDNIDIKEYNKDTNFEIVQTKNNKLDYKWIYTIDDEDVISLKETKEETKENEESITNIHYVFNINKEGETTVTFKYVSNDEKNIDETKKYSIKIDKNMDVSIEEKRD